MTETAVHNNRIYYKFTFTCFNYICKPGKVFIVIIKTCLI